MARGRRTLQEALGARRRVAPPAPVAEAEAEDLEGPPLVAPRSGIPASDESPLGLMNTALVEGDLEAAHRHWLAAWQANGYEMAMRELAPDAFARISRIARAHARIGRFAPSDLLLRFDELSDEHIAQLALTRGAGDDAEQMAWSSPDTATKARLRQPTDARELFALARALVRIPHRFGNHKIPALDEPAQVTVEVSPRLLVDLAAAWRTTPGFAGVRLVRGNRKQGATVSVLHMAVELEAVVEGRPMRMSVSVRLGNSKATDSQERLRSARGLIKRHLPDLAGLADELEDADAFRGLSGLTPLTRPLGATAPALTAEQLLGADDCDHATARWRRNNAIDTGAFAVDAVVRDCPACHRDRLEVVPLHRLEPDHRFAGKLEAPEVEESYLARERFHAELAGDPRPVVSLAQLRARDGAVVLTGEEEPPEQSAPGRSESLGEAFAAGRRRAAVA